MPTRIFLGNEGGFILTSVAQHQDLPELWGFEVFTNKWQQLAHFTYSSEAEATWAATNFAWVLGRITHTGKVEHGVGGLLAPL